MYKIERRGEGLRGGVQKSFSRNIPLITHLRTFKDKSLKYFKSEVKNKNKGNGSIEIF